MTHMNIKNGPLALALVFLSTVFIVCSSSTVYSQENKPAAAKETRAEKLLKEIKVDYAPFNTDNSFVVSYASKEIKQIDVIVIQTENMMVFLADAAAASEVDLTPAKMRKLLEFNNAADYIKVGISVLGSIRVSSEQESSRIDAKFFESLLDQIANGTEAVAKMIGPIKQKPAAGK